MVMVVVTAGALLPIAVQSICPNNFGMYGDMAALFFFVCGFFFFGSFVICIGLNPEWCRSFGSRVTRLGEEDG